VNIGEGPLTPITDYAEGCAATSEIAQAALA
jgi:hypothetical protein